MWHGEVTEAVDIVNHRAIYLFRWITVMNLDNRSINHFFIDSI